MEDSQGSFEYADDYPGGDPAVEYPRLSRPVATAHKAEFIARYLFFFSLVTKHGNYIDAFAGPQEEDRTSTAWSARRVLEEQPKSFGIRDFYLFEKDGGQFARLEALKEEHANHRGRVHLAHGDSNVLVPELLASDSLNPKHATFALLDQRGLECSWGTVEALANFARGQKHKTELLYFLPAGWLHRSLSGAKKETARRWWGDDGYEEFLSLGKVEIATAFADRLVKILGYKAATPWPFYDREHGEGSLRYHMVHATDHQKAPKLIARAYRTLGQATEALFEQPPLFEAGESEADSAALSPAQQGGRAWKRGAKPSACPFTPKSPAGKAWAEGWNRAREEYLATQLSS